MKLVVWKAPWWAELLVEAGLSRRQAQLISLLLDILLFALLLANLFAYLDQVHRSGEREQCIAINDSWYLCQKWNEFEVRSDTPLETALDSSPSYICSSSEDLPS